MIVKDKGRILNWKSKFLSFGGRRQLIISVLQSLQLHWMFVFLFPSRLTHDLESIFWKFLWAPRDGPRGRCRLSWEVVCRPLQSGGLAIRRVTTWNRALLAKHVWDIVRHRDSLWVRWVYRHNLRSSHFWLVRKNSNCSWVFRKLLDLRLNLRWYLVSQIGDGKDINAWEDTWLPCGHLTAFMSYHFIHSCGFSIGTTVRELIMSLGGVWSDEWCSRFDVLTSAPLPSLIDAHRDQVLWGGDSTSISGFKVGTGSCPSFWVSCPVRCAKNLILASVKYVTLHDEGAVELWELNNVVLFSRLPTKLTKEQLSNFQLLDACHKILHQVEIPFLEIPASCMHYETKATFSRKMKALSKTSTAIYNK
ncbi:uncharacterized protein LOC112504083 [Cynara cardunculus var. scolymus]|uniref:uncharacterized protein LOC112504083 n=1 Tax=Cynara cardunculus var. scolymus TaxID=59895 RepID=UPI000D6246B8|nr:uncharacterized protein LOC112504083 [Cynara cardunculus var. scolymus]